MIDFKDYEKLIWKEAHLQARKCGREVEEFFSIGCAEFVRSKKVWEDKKGKNTVSFSNWLTRMIRFEYINEGLVYQRQKRVAKENPEEFSYFFNMNDSLGRDPSDMALFKISLDRLSEDAKKVVDLALDPQPDLPRLSKTALRRYFSEAGWSNKRTEAAFQEISAMLS